MDPKGLLSASEIVILSAARTYAFASGAMAQAKCIDPSLRFVSFSMT